MLTERGLNWVLNGVGAIALIVGGILVLWALFADRSRGRKRCPKCWYDLTASPGMRCSECGFVARTERKLRKTRRRWRRGVVGLFIIAVGLAGPGYREYHDDWHRLVPTTALILWMPDLEKKQPKLYGSLESRMADDRLADWQWEWLLDRCLDENNLPIYLDVKTRPRWPEGVDVHYELRAEFGLRAGWLSSSDIEFRVLEEGAPILERGWNLPWSPSPTPTESLPSVAIRQVRPPPDASRVTIRVDQELGIQYIPPIVGQTFLGSPIPTPPPRLTSTPRKMIRSIPFELSVSVGGAVDDVIEPVRDETIDESLIRSASLSSVARRTKGTSGVYVGVPRSIARRQPGLAVAVEIALIFDGETIKTDRMFLQPGMLHLVLFPKGVDQLDLNSLDRLTVRIRGDGELALRDFDATSYWAGDITFLVQKAAPVRLSE